MRILNIRILDALAILWKVSCPSKVAVVKDFLPNIRHYIQDLLKSSGVYFIIDPYFTRSIKRLVVLDPMVLQDGIGRLYYANYHQKTKILAVTENKKQLIQIIVDDLKNNPFFS